MTKIEKARLKFAVIERDKACCVNCQSPHYTIHHVYGGKNRNISDEHSEFMVLLCWACHQGTNGVHGKNGNSLDLKMKRKAQERFEKNHTREEFMSLIGRSYL